MTRYIDQAVKRAEYARRFKEDGQGFRGLLNKAQRSGASPQDIDRAEKYMQAMMGTLGADIDPKYQKLQGALMVYQNLRLLAMSTLTSLADPVGIMVRGDLESGWAAFKAGIDEVRAKAKGDQTELRRLAAMLGTIDIYMSNEALGWEYGGHFVTGRARKINETFFRLDRPAGVDPELSAHGPGWCSVLPGETCQRRRQAQQALPSPARSETGGYQAGQQR